MLDLIIAAIVIIGLITGITTGLLRQVIGLAGLVISVILATRFAGSVGDAITGSLGIMEENAGLLGFIAVLLGVYIGAMIVAKLAASVIKTLHLSGLNRLAGGIFGAVKSVLLVGVMLILLGNLWELPPRDMVQSSILYDPVMEVMNTAWEIAGEHIPDDINISGLPSSGNNP